ncbi:MAG: aldehyde ferredoxin oxidoreductase family protein [Asgard group archaeon]|nr:aldehyde ferredoxin oxidoreductase family protein [Asgard group archaeon]
MAAFRGKLLRINLNDKTHQIEDLNPELMKFFLGGSGLAAYLYWDFINKLEKIPEPFETENPIYFLTGILTGLPGYCTARANFCSRSPLTGIFGESNIGGKIGPQLKFAGYDGIIIEGKAESPVYIVIKDSQIEIRNATKFWGKGTYETIDLISEELSDSKYEIACIGPAGENLVKYACIMTTGGRAAGRTGMGAIFGSKNLKALAVKGSNNKFDITTDFIEVAKETYEIIKNDYSAQIFSEFGTAGYVDVALDLYGDMPIKNWSKGTLEGGNALSGLTMAETILTGKSTCYRCPIACGREIEIKEGPYKLEKTDGPEFETLSAFGTNLMITNLEAVSYANHLANDFGYDTISCGGTIGTLFDLVEKGFIPKEELPKDINCKFGDEKALIEILKLIAYRKGIGNMLAEGSRILALKYKGEGLAPQIAGLEAPYHDPRAFSGLALMYATSPRGACHLNGDAYFSQQGVEYPEIGIANFPDRHENTNLVKQLVHLQSYRQLFNAIGLCQFYNPTATKLAKLLSIVFSSEVKPMDLILFGDRLYALKRLINIKLGWKPELEKIPKVMMQKLEGPTNGFVPDFISQLNEWYIYRNYNRQTGQPKEEEIKRLGLDNYIIN